MNSFKEYYNLKEGWRDYMPTVAKGYDKAAAKGREVKSKFGTGAYDDMGWDAMKKAGRIAQKVNPYAKGNVIGKAADSIDRFTKRLQGDVSADTAEFDAFRRKIAKIYTSKNEPPAGPGMPAGNTINTEVAVILNDPGKAPPRGTGRKNKLTGEVTYSPEYTTYIDAVDRGQLFDLVNFHNPKGTGVYKDAHHFANIVLDQMSAFLSGGKYSYKDAVNIIYGQPGSGTGMFNPEAIAVLDKHGMLYRQ
jgi:hypothetical protein